MNDEQTSVEEEVKAFAAVRRALDKLDRGACTRVLSWAHERYVSAPVPDIDPQAMQQFFAACAEVSSKLGGMTGEDVLKAAHEIVRVREQQKETT